MRAACRLPRRLEGRNSEPCRAWRSEEGALLDCGEKLGDAVADTGVLQRFTAEAHAVQCQLRPAIRLLAEDDRDAHRAERRCGRQHPLLTSDTRLRHPRYRPPEVGIGRYAKRVRLPLRHIDGN